MSTTITLTLEDIPEAVFQRLRLSALAHQRSLNNEVIAQLDSALQPARASTDVVLARIRKSRAALNFVLTDDDINKFKHEGRP